MNKKAPGRKSRGFLINPVCEHTITLRFIGGTRVLNFCFECTAGAKKVSNETLESMYLTIYRSV